MRRVALTASLSLCALLSVVPLLAGEPVIAIRVAEYARGLTLVFPSGGTLGVPGAIPVPSRPSVGACIAHDPEEVAAVDLPPGARVEIVGELTQPARKRYHVMVGSARLVEPEAQERLRTEWSAAGYPLTPMSAGRVFPGPDGRTLHDGRILLYGIRTYDDASAAQALVDELAAKARSSWIQTEVLASASGRLRVDLGDHRVLVGDCLQAALPAVPGRALPPTASTALHLLQVEHARGYSWHGFADRSFAGPLTIAFGANDSLEVVEAVPLERLLTGIVPAEISWKAAPEALMAQAAAARGEILAKLGQRHLGEGFEFCSEQHCQVYAGISELAEKVAPAVAACRGEVLVSDKGLVDAVYAGNCGGHSEPNHLVWTSPPDPVLSGVWDTKGACRLDLRQERDLARWLRHPPPCPCGDATVEGGAKFRWTRALDAAAIAGVVERAGVGRIKALTGFERGPSGRLCKLTVIGEKGEKTVLKELNIRRLLGGLFSACFVIDKTGRDPAGFVSSLALRGAGFGHGVGMCQTGAQARAKAGEKHAAILAHYYPGSRLLQVW